MDVLAKLTENILATIDGVGAAIVTVLDVNYFLAATIVQIISHTTSVLSNLTLLFYQFLVSAIEDFQFFATEVFGCLQYLVKFGIHVVEEVCGLVAGGVSGAGVAWGSVRKGFGSALGNLTTLFGEILRTVCYVAAVFVDALLILLQCIPYTFVLLLQCIVGIVQWVFQSARNFAWRTRNSAVRSTLAVVDAIQRIPVDAFVGLTVMVVVYVLYRKTPLGYYMSPVKLARMARKAFRSTCRVATRVMLHRIPNTGRHLLRCIMGCLSYFSEVFRSWFTVDGGLDEEDDDEYMHQQGAAQPNSSSVAEDGATSSNSGDGDKQTSEDLERLRKELEHQKERNLCIICQDQPKSVMLLPCRHFCLCEECCTELLDRRSTCPLCRTPILSPIQAFI